MESMYATSHAVPVTVTYWLLIAVPSVVVTDGPRGAYVRHEGVESHVPAFPCEPKDLTGAGDAFAGTMAGRSQRRHAQ